MQESDKSKIASVMDYTLTNAILVNNSVTLSALLGTNGVIDINISCINTPRAHKSDA